MKQEVSIYIEGLYKSYGRSVALRNISMEVKSGELFGFIGPDGAGKTTLFRIITTLLLPDKGVARVKGLDVESNFREIRGLLGYMPGRFSLYHDLSIEENLNFFASIFKVSFDSNFYLIRDIYNQLEPFKERLAGKLSGGMKQKLALCCALIHKPQLLVLDEPTTGVDAVSRAEFWQMLQNLKNEGITIIVSTPYMDEAVMCDRIALIQKGKILKINTPEVIVNDFEKSVIKVKAKNQYLLLKDLQEYPHTHMVYPFGQYLHFIPSENSLSFDDLHLYLSGKGHEDIIIEPANPEIEDCFMELMGKDYA